MTDTAMTDTAMTGTAMGVTAADVAEYDRFGPWIDEVVVPEDVPRLYRTFPLDLSATRVVKLLEGKGLVERRPSAADGRVHEAVLTEAGRRRLNQARPSHVASVRRRIFNKFDGLDLSMCTTALMRMSEEESNPPHQERTLP